VEPSRGRVKPPEADYLAALGGLMADTGRLHRNIAVRTQPSIWQCASSVTGNLGIAPLTRPGGRIAALAENERASALCLILNPMVPTWRRTAAR
jgi:hypothetical protein